MKYQSQFVPTDFNTANSLLGMFRQDMAKRDADFDQASFAESEALAQLGSISTADVKGRNERLDYMTKAMQEAVAKKGGDYGAAAKDLYRIVAKEKSNPWYQFNNEQQRALEDYRKLSLNADNMIIGNPKVSYQDYEKAVANGQDPFTVRALSKTAAYNQASDVFSKFANIMESDPKFKSTLGGQYFQAMKQYGVTPEALEGFLQTGEGKKITESLIAANPELQGANKEQFMEIIKQGAYSALGKADTQYLANRGYDTGGGRSSSGGATKTPGFSYYSNMSIEEKTSNIEKDFSLLRSAVDDNGNIDPSKLEKEQGKVAGATQMLVDDVFSVINKVAYEGEDMFKTITGMFGANYKKSGTKYGDYFEAPKIGTGSNAKSKVETLNELYKDKYSNIYNQIKSSGGLKAKDFKTGKDKIYKSDKDFLDIVEYMEISNSVIEGTEIGVDDYDISKDIFNKTREIGDKDEPVFINMKNGKGLTRLEAEERLGTKQVQMRVDGYGNIKVQIPDKKEKYYEDYMINPKALPKNVTAHNEDINEIRDIVKSFNLSDEKIKEVNSTVYSIGGQYFQMMIDPSNPTKKNLYRLAGKDPNTGEIIREPSSMSELQLINTYNTYSGINNQNK